MKLAKLVDLKSKFEIYIGRMDYSKAPPAGSVMFVFSNPYCWREFGREKAFKKYRKYFRRRINADLGFRAALDAISGKSLACSCKTDQFCHGKIIVDHLNQEQS